MAKDIEIGFEMDIRLIPLDKIILKQEIAPKIRSSQKYQQVVSTIRHAGVVEQIVVFPSDEMPGFYKLLDGDARLDVLLSLEATEAYCLISKTEETFTYNYRTNQLSPIQEHLMVLKAIDKGVCAEDLAQALNVDISHIRAKRDLMNGICPEAATAMKDHPFTPTVIRILRKLKPTQQITAVQQMLRLGNFSERMANHILITTPPDLLADSKRSKHAEQLSSEALAEMRTTMENSRTQQEEIRTELGVTSITLNRICSHYDKMLRNPRVLKHLQKHQPRVLEELTHALSPYRAVKHRPAA
jgi:ParB-like chromosome segregation protein Spo0J